MEHENPIIENNVQDTNSLAWRKLCLLIDEAAENEWIEFFPSQVLGVELFSQIHTLPKSISKLKKVKKLILYGSSLKRIPPEIGAMEALEDFDPYTSYDLHWFPFEIINCKNLIESRVSTRTLYGNYKNQMPFPDLKSRPVEYSDNLLTCSLCRKVISHNQTTQLWVTTPIGTDILPLLANVCSKKCKDGLSEFPKPPARYSQTPHKGGLDISNSRFSVDEDSEKKGQTKSTSGFNPIQFIRNFWSKK
jgi:hypothetical protein